MPLEAGASGLRLSRQTVDLETLRQDLDPSGAGHEAGQQGLPPPDARFDPAERTITDELDRRAQLACDRLADRRAEMLGHLAEGSGSELASDMHATVQRALGNLENVAKSAQMHLEQRQRECEQHQRAYYRFRRDHGLSGREPHYPDVGGRWFRYGVVAFLFVVESVANSAFLAKGNELGIVGAYVVAFGISALNLLSSFLLFGRISCYLVHVHRGWRILSGALMAVYAAFALVLNLGVAHYREVSGELIGEAGVEVVRRMGQDPLGLQDAESWLLFGLGFLFSLIAFYDGRSMDDPYPGYGQCHRTWRRAQDDFSDALEDVQEELSDEWDRSLDEVKRLAHDARTNPETRRRIADSWRQQIAEYDRHVSHLRQVGEVLIEEYREANRAARPDRLNPAAHAIPWTLAVPEIDRGDLPGLDERGLTPEESRRIEEAYTGATDQIHHAFKAWRDWLAQSGPGGAAPRDGSPG